MDSVGSREVDGTFGSSFRTVGAVGSVAAGSAAATRSRICSATSSAEAADEGAGEDTRVDVREGVSSSSNSSNRDRGRIIRQDVAGDESASGEISGDGREEYLVCGVLRAVVRTLSTDETGV